MMRIIALLYIGIVPISSSTFQEQLYSKLITAKHNDFKLLDGTDKTEVGDGLALLSPLLCKDSAASNNIFDFSKSLLMQRNWNTHQDLDRVASNVVKCLVGDRNDERGHGLREALDMNFPEEETFEADFPEKDLKFLRNIGLNLPKAALKRWITKVFPFDLPESQTIISEAGGEDSNPEESMLLAYLRGKTYQPITSSVHLESLVGYLLPESACEETKISVQNYLCFKLFKMKNLARKALLHFAAFTDSQLKESALTSEDINFVIDNISHSKDFQEVLKKVSTDGHLSLARESIASLGVEKISGYLEDNSIFIEAAFLSLLKDPSAVPSNQETLQLLAGNGLFKDHINFLSQYPSESIKAVELYCKELGQFNIPVDQTYFSINKMISLKSPSLTSEQRIALLVELIGDSSYDDHGLQPSWLFERFGNIDAPLNKLLDVRDDCLGKIERINEALENRSTPFWMEVVAEMYANMLAAASRLEANDENLEEWISQKKISTTDIDQIISGQRSFKETTRFKAKLNAIHPISPSVLADLYKSMQPPLISRLSTHITSYYNNGGATLMSMELIDADIIKHLPEPSKYLETGIIGAQRVLEVMALFAKFTSGKNISLLLSFLENQSADSDVWYIVGDAIPHVKVQEHIYLRIRRITSAITRSHLPLLHAFIKSLEVPVELKNVYVAALENLIKLMPTEWKLGIGNLSKPIDRIVEALIRILLSTKVCIRRGDLFDSCKSFGTRFAKIFSENALWQGAVLGNSQELKIYVEYLSFAIAESRVDDIELYAPFLKQAIERGCFLIFLKALNQRKIVWDILFGNVVKDVADLASFSYLAEAIFGKDAKLTWRQWLELVPLMRVYRKYSEMRYVPTLDSNIIESVKRTGDGDFAIKFDEVVGLLTSKFSTNPANKEQALKLSNIFKDGAKSVMHLDAWKLVFSAFLKDSESNDELSATILLDVVEEIIEHNKRVEFHPPLFFSDKEWEGHLREVPLGMPWKTAIENLCETCSSIIKHSVNEQDNISPQNRIAVYTRIMDRVTQSTAPKCRTTLFTEIKTHISPLLNYEDGQQSPLDVIRSQIFGQSPIINSDIISAAIFSQHGNLENVKKLTLLNNAFAAIDPYSNPSFDSPAVDFTKKELLKDISKDESRMITEKLAHHSDPMIAFQVRSALNSHSHYKLASILNELIPDRNFELLLSFLTESPYSGSKNNKNSITKLLQMMEISLSGKSGDLKIEDGMDVKAIAKMFSFQTVSSLKSCNYLDMASYAEISVNDIQSLGDECFTDLGQKISEIILNTPRFLQSLKSEQITPKVLQYIMPGSLYFFKPEILGSLSPDSCRALTEVQILGLHSSENLHHLSPTCIKSLGPKWVYALIPTTFNKIHPEIEGIMRILDIENFKSINEDLIALHVQGRHNGLPSLWKLLGESVATDLHPCRAIEVDLGYQFYQGASKKCLLSTDLNDPTKTFFEKTKMSRLNFVSRDVWASMANEALHLLEKGNRLKWLDEAMTSLLETTAAEAKHIDEL